MKIKLSDDMTLEFKDKEEISASEFQQLVYKLKK